MQRTIFKASYDRILFLFCFLSIGFILLFLRIMMIYYWSFEDCSLLSEKNYSKETSLSPVRGILTDVKGRHLATNKMVFDFLWDGKKATNYSADQFQHLLFLFQKLGFNSIDPGRLHKAVARKEQIVLVTDLSFEACAEATEVLAGFEAVSSVSRVKRFYPHRTTASHLLGYMQRGDNKESLKAVAGLERLLQSELEGEPGRAKQIINAKGVLIESTPMQQPQAGKQISLTIDLSLQQIIENALTADQAGAVVLLDPADGSIKAMASFPNFDPNRFLQNVSFKEWQEQFQQQSPLLNRATQGLYPAASLFKLVTFAAGLEEGLLTPETEFECKGYSLYCGRKYYCQRHWGHGVLSAHDALAYSCNIPCFEIAKQIDIDTLAWYAQDLGLGDKTGLFLPEKNGLMPTKSWKQAIKHESWWKGETLSVSIGQSYIMVTPLQMACMMGSIFTGYRVRPRILVDEAVQTYPISLAPQTRFFLQESMALGVRKGTSKRLSFYDQFTLYAKTGTAQTSSLRTQQEKCMRSQYEHGWCATYFVYKDHPPLVLIVLIEHAGSSRSALDAVQRVLCQYAERA